MRDNQSVLKTETGLNPVVHMTPGLTETILRLPVRADPVLLTINLVSQAEILSALAQHAPHPADIRTLQLEHGITETRLRVITGRHGLMVALLKGAVKTIDQLLFVGHALHLSHHYAQEFRAMRRYSAVAYMTTQGDNQAILSAEYLSMPRCVILALNGGPLTSVVGPLEILTLAARVAGAPDWQFDVVGDDDGSEPAIPALSGTGRFEQVNHADALIISAMGDPRRRKRPLADATLQRICTLARQNTHIISICSGAYALARAGLLDGRKATCHWLMADWMAQEFPHCQWQPQAMITRDGNIWCSGGASAWQDISLSLAQHWFGTDTAQQCARLLLLENDRDDQRRFMGFVAGRQHQDQLIHQVQDWLDLHAGETFTLEQLAAQVNLSERQFKRRFSAAVQMPPRTYVQSLRMEQAKRALVQSKRQVDTIARACGYEDVRFFRTLFRRTTGLTPQAYRAKFSVPQ